MDATNPYQTPSATIEPSDIPAYQPRVFALSGRIGRLRYIVYGTGVMLLSNLLLGFAGSLGGAVALGSPELALTVKSLTIGLLYLALIAITFIYARRRLNDLNRTGLLGLLFIVPVANLLLALYLLFGRGSDGPNRYGAEPCANSLAVKILVLLLPILIIGILAAIAIPAYMEYLQRASAMP